MASKITYAGKTGDTRFKISSKYIAVTDVKVNGSTVGYSVSGNECVVSALGADVAVDIYISDETDLLYGAILSGTAGVFKASAGSLYSYAFHNRTAADRYVQFYNKATTPTINTDTIVRTVHVKPQSSAILADIRQAVAAGLAWGITTDLAGTTAATSLDVQGTVRYI